MVGSSSSKRQCECSLSNQFFRDGRFVVDQAEPVVYHIAVLLYDSVPGLYRVRGCSAAVPRVAVVHVRQHDIRHESWNWLDTALMYVFDASMLRTVGKQCGTVW